jgi:hypothetical protein
MDADPLEHALEVGSRAVLGFLRQRGLYWGWLATTDRERRLACPCGQRPPALRATDSTRVGGLKLTERLDLRKV